ncbi:hypothetical protein FA13DRAFT_189156 [Coprinellus micaceus]|jgi:arabinan endo-1,5-alpha-L-arabinosidase|uniref:F5/8 type C domain-containing protein n=1 Tax=Coprinellus micaceus TaxID=71717 RepID=A0A4Y7TGK0_COPMI|nr:hypothetical protein FA13DRAFT_189156 [Coprinellus micaceus]
MFPLKAYLLVAISAFASLVAAVPGPGHVTGSTDVQDPTICKDSNGKYCLFCASIPLVMYVIGARSLTRRMPDSNRAGIDIRISTDRTNWTRIGQAFPNGAATWTDAYTGTENGSVVSSLSWILLGASWGRSKLHFRWQQRMYSS